MKIKITLLAYAFGILAALANSANSPEFKILRLGTEETNLAQPPSLVTGSQGGIAVNAEKVFMTDSLGRTTVFDRNSRENAARTAVGLTSLCSDFLSGKVYVFLDTNNNQIGSGGGTIAKLAEVNSSGEILQNRINLSQAITIGGYTGIFSGYGRVAIYTGGRVYDIQVPTGQVQDLGDKSITLNRVSSSDWAAWGIAEFFEGGLHLVYVRTGKIIERIRVSDQNTERLFNSTSFQSFGELNALSVWPDSGGWFFYTPSYTDSSGVGLRGRLGFPSADFSATRVLVKSAQMRPGTTLMDVVYRVVDHERPTAKIRALAFKDGVRSFANVLRPTTFVEGTGSKIGDSVATNQDHTLTWDVAADWNVDLGQVKFEVLALDPNGLLPFKGITIPAANGKPELKINQTGLTDSHVLNALFWMYADGHPDMAVANGKLIGAASSGVFKDKEVVRGSTLNPIYAHQFLFKLMNIAAADTDIIKYAETATRTTKFSRDKWLTTSWPYEGSQFVYTWGASNQDTAPQPQALIDVSQISTAGYYSMALKKDGSVAVWAQNNFDTQYLLRNVPDNVKNITQIAAGQYVATALNHDGEGFLWGPTNNGHPLRDYSTGISKISKSGSFIKNDSSAYLFGYGIEYQRNNKKIIEVDEIFILTDDKTLSTPIVWYNNPKHYRFSTLQNIKSFSIGASHGIALRSDGTVTGWGDNTHGQLNIPINLTDVIAVAAGSNHNLALKSDGTVVAWGLNTSGQCNVPSDVKNVVGIAAGGDSSAAFTAKAP